MNRQHRDSALVREVLAKKSAGDVLQVSISREHEEMTELETGTCGGGEQKSSFKQTAWRRDAYGRL